MLPDDLREALDVLQRDPANTIVAKKNLSPETRASVLRWFSNSPYDESAVEQALTVLWWCQENSGIFLYPPSIRKSTLEAAAHDLRVPVERLTDLIVNNPLAF
jgi:hypothetical protein